MALSLLLLAVLFTNSVRAGWDLTFSDEFNDQTKLNTSKWNPFYVHTPAIINAELQWYGPDQFQFTQTTLKIVADRTFTGPTSVGNFTYRSGTMTTAHKFTQTYGYFEMRAKHPGNAPGLWPAFWLLNDDGSPGETDIMEQILSKPDEVVTTFHCWREGWAKGNSTKNINYASGWHTYSLQWIPGKVIWYVDGVEVWSFSSDCVENKPNYILANMAVGGSWPGAPTNATVFPAYFEIDYIRAYKYNPNGGSTLAGPGNGISYTPIVGTENPIRIGFTQATPETQSANGTVTISTTLTSDVTYDSAAVQFQYSNDTKDIATQSVMGTAASLVAGVPKVITNTFRIPASQSPGFIRVSVGYFSVNGSYWKNLKWETTTVIFGVDRVVGQYPTQSLTTNAVTTKPLTTNMAPLTTNMAPLTTKAMTTKPLTTRAVTTGLAMTTKAVTTKPLTTREATTAPVTSGVVTSGIAPEVTTGERGRPSPDVPDEVVTDSEDTNMSEAFALRAGWAITSLVVVLIPALI